jgi:hypothetical protein
MPQEGQSAGGATQAEVRHMTLTEVEAVAHAEQQYLGRPAEALGQ